MPRIAIDEMLSEQLNALTGSVDICDTTSRVIGRFVRTNDAATYIGREPRISEEEREERRKYTGRTSTTAEVLKRLEGL